MTNRFSDLTEEAKQALMRGELGDVSHGVEFDALRVTIDQAFEGAYGLVLTIELNRDKLCLRRGTFNVNLGDSLTLSGVVGEFIMRLV